VSFEYIQENYHVPAEFGRKVIVYGRAATIVEDRGHHIGITYDDEMPGRVHSAHPTCEVQYLDMGTVRKLSRSKLRYRRYLACDGRFSSFLEFCRWDAQVQREFPRCC
jgi:hypothetical protein